jgi:hypothetical protein
MESLHPHFFYNRRGSTFVSVLVSAAIIAAAIGGVGASAVALGKAIKKASTANLAIATEANIVAAFHDKKNYPDPIFAGAGAATAPGSSLAIEGLNGGSPNKALRAGTLMTFPLQVSFEGHSPLLIPVPINDGSSGIVGYLDEDLNACVDPAGFSAKCLIRYEVRLKKITTTGISYSFSYQVDANPDLITMAPLGDATEFTIPIDPGNYRAELNLTHCDKDSSLFVTGVNRDTGEVFCAKKPSLNSCPPKTFAKGLKYVQYANQPPTIELDCTSSEMRVFKCSDNYALQTFNPQYIDPENNSFSTAPGKCVFLASHQAVTSAYLPATPTSPYVKTVSGTFCPPFYSSGGASACVLIPDSNKNNSASAGLGKCAPTKYKDCQRLTHTEAPDGTSLCSFTQTSKFCDGVPTTSTSCSTLDAWSMGTPYADAVNAYPVKPTAQPRATSTGRQLSCTFDDTSPPCSAPDTDINDAPWGKKAAKWYGGVQVQDVICTYDPSQGKPEVINAL